MKKTRIRFFKFSDGKQNLQFHWPKRLMIFQCLHVRIGCAIHFAAHHELILILDASCIQITSVR
jgi:hypothetical protein